MWLGRTHTGDRLAKAASLMLSIIREVDWATGALTHGPVFFWVCLRVILDNIAVALPSETGPHAGTHCCVRGDALFPSDGLFWPVCGLGLRIIPLAQACAAVSPGL